MSFLSYWFLVSLIILAVGQIALALENTCTKHTECKSDERCIKNKCQHPSLNGECEEELDCIESQKCIDNKCTSVKSTSSSSDSFEMNAFWVAITVFAIFFFMFVSCMCLCSLFACLYISIGVLCCGRSAPEIITGDEYGDPNLSPLPPRGTYPVQAGQRVQQHTYYHQYRPHRNNNTGVEQSEYGQLRQNVTLFSTPFNQQRQLTSDSN